MNGVSNSKQEFIIGFGNINYSLNGRTKYLGLITFCLKENSLRSLVWFDSKRVGCKKLNKKRNKSAFHMIHWIHIKKFHQKSFFYFSVKIDFSHILVPGSNLYSMAGKWMENNWYHLIRMLSIVKYLNLPINYWIGVERYLFWISPNFLDYPTRQQREETYHLSHL